MQRVGKCFKKVFDWTHKKACMQRHRCAAAYMPCKIMKHEVSVEFGGELSAPCLDALFGQLGMIALVYGQADHRAVAV